MTCQARSSRQKLFPLIGALLWAPAAAWADAHVDRTEAPHILVTSEVSQPDPLPLKENGVDVQIAGVIAHVRVTQVYQNEGQEPLEAIYVFPGSTRAAVFAMRMQIGDRTIEAKIDKRAAARQQYEQAREAGQTASLLEQHRPNVFQMSVANVLPGDTVKVQLDYTELLVPTDGVYDFVYPAVVGPRYTGEQTKSETWHQNPYLGEGEPEPYRYRLGVKLAAGMGIQDLASPSHKVEPRFRGPDRAELTLDTPGDGNRDFVLRYRLRGGAIQTGLLRYEGDKESFFLLMVQPPQRVARDEMPPREYVFIVDVSGSMTGFPLDVAKEVVADLLRGMRPVDRFNILFFAGGSYQLSERSVVASKENVAHALRVLEERSAGGGTELLGALKKAFAMPASSDTSRTFVAVTDGYVAVEAEAFSLIKKNLDKANFFAFGIGSSVNRHLIEGMARAGQGEPFVVLDPGEAKRQGRRFRKMIETPALTHIRVSYQGIDAYEVEPPAIPDLLAERPLLIFGKYRGGKDGVIEVRGTHGRGKFEHAVRVADAAPDPDFDALRYLWARHRIRSLMDDGAFAGRDVEEEVTRLGLAYNLLTQYTSFVAVDAIARNPDGNPTEVEQPLPLPAGVTSNALGAVAMSPPPWSSGGYAVDGANCTGIAASQEYAYVQVAYDAAALRSISDVRSSSLSPHTLPPLRLSVGQRLQLSNRGEANAFATPTLLRLGVVRRVEARLGSSLLSIVDGDVGAPDLSVGAKVSLLTDSRFAVGLLVDARLDFSEDNPEEWHHRAALLTEAALWRRALLRVRLGLDLLSLAGADELDVGVGYGAELAYGFGRRWLVFGGLTGVTNGDATALSTELGAGLLLGHELELGLSASAGVTDAAEDGAAGVFLRWQR